MTEDHIVLLVLETLGCTMLILGYLIKYKQKITLIAGVYKNETKITDKRGFASLVGGNVLVSGILFCIGAVGIYWYPAFKNLIESILLLSILATIILTYTGSQKYLQKEE